jgi:hypothetical protein
MSFFRRAKEVTYGLASAGTRQAQRGKLHIEVRRLESKVGSENAAIGQVVYPLLEAGTLVVDLPEVAAHVKAISELLAEVARKRAEIDSLGATDAEKRDERLTESVQNIEFNATSKASSEQSAKDVAAEEKEGNPAEQGGQG